jgi:opacity protein-like surface antigen
MKKGLWIIVLLALMSLTLSALGKQEVSGAQQAQVIASNAEIFLEANQHSIVIDTVPRGTIVTLFQSGNKNKKWLYISYFSEKRSSRVTGFIDSNRVEILQESPEKPQDTSAEKESFPDEVEPESQEKIEEQTAKDETATSSDKEAQEITKELEEHRNLLQKMEKEKLEIQKQEVALAAGVQQEQETEEQTGSQTKENAHQEESQSTTEPLEKETADSQKAVDANTKEAEENKDPAQKPEDNNGKEPPAEKAPPVEETPDTIEEELPKVLTKVAVKVPRANIRLLPTTKSAVISQVPSGVELKHLAKTGNWHRVNLAPNKEGFILSGYIHNSIVNEIFETFVPPPPEPEEKQETESEIVEEETKPEPAPVQKVLPQRKQSFGEYFWVGGGAGYTMPSESNFEKGMNFCGTFGIGVMKHLAIELRVPYFQSDVTGTVGGLSSGRLSNLSLMLSIQARYPIKNRFVPYLVAGGDYHLNKFSVNQEIKDSWSNLGFNIEESVNHTFGFHFGAGLDFFLYQNIALNLDARYYTANLKGQRTLANQISQDMTSGTIEGMKLNSFQAAISVKLFLNPIRKR